MPTEHKVQLGDSVIKLSEEHGFFAQTIWDAAENAGLRECRGDMNELLPGDAVVIPDKRLKEVEKPADQRHRFRRKGIPAVFRLQLFQGEEPRANEAYELRIGNRVWQGETDASGVLAEYIPATAESGELTIGPDGYRLLVRFDHLGPLSEIAGVQGRLNNLGYDCGEPDNALNEATRGALQRFQRRLGLPETGEADAATVAKLGELHDTTSPFPR
jgi:hypothetical protein